MYTKLNLDREYSRNPNIKREEIQKLLQWLQTQPHIPALTELEIMLFYAAANCNVERTKQVIDNNLTFRTHSVEYFGCYDVEATTMDKALKTYYGYFLPKRTPEGYGVIYSKLAFPELATFDPTSCLKFAGYLLKNKTPDGYGVVMAKLLNKDVTNFNFTDSVKLYFLGQDIILQEIGILPGFIFVVDLSDATFAHLTRVGLQQLKKALYYLQEAIPLRIKGLHFVNIVPFMDKILALMSPFMKKELMDLLHVHASLDTFYEIVPREILPEELGGKEPHSKVLSAAFYQKLRDNRLDLMEFNSQRRINEKLRPGQMKNPSDIFGTAGNFKKLDFD